MRVAELMKTDLKTISIDATVGDVIVALAEADASALPVIDHAGRVVGIVSAREVREVLKAASACHGPARDRLFDETRALEIMAAWPVTVTPETDVRDAAREMLYLEVPRLFVEHEGALVGVITQTDIVGAMGAARI